MTCSEKDLRKALEEIFDKFDTDHSGQLDCKELNQVLTCYYKGKKDSSQVEKECKDIVAALDKNKDGTVSKKEFIDFVMKCA